MKGMHPLLRKWLSIFLVFLLVGVLGGGLALGALIGYLNTLPKIDALENYNPSEISRVYDRSGNKQIGEFFKDRRQLVRIKDIPEHVLNAFIAIEDERFYHHFGVDMKGIARAFYENFRSGGKAQGASTITMQVARNVVLDDLSKNYMRKIKEIFLALQIERDFSKDQILELYLNHIFFGARAYGIQEASKAYFNKDVKDLNIPEAAMLAGLPKAPTQLSPFNNETSATERRNLVMFNMKKLGYIKTDAEYKRLTAMPIELNPPATRKTIAPYFVDYVSHKLMRENSYQAANELGKKAYQIISTVDLELQKLVEDELSKGLRDVEKEIEAQKESRQAKESGDLGGVAKGQARLARITEVKEGSIKVSVGGYSATVPLPEKLPYFEPDKIVRKGNLIDIYIANISKGKLEAYLYDKQHVQGAAVLIDAKTGEIVALAGGDDRNDAANNGQWNRAFQGGRQPGSCWKPLLYAGALDVNDSEGNPRYTAGTVIQDGAYSVGNWSPKNYENKYYGPTALHEALVKSRNIPTVKLFMEIGPTQSVNIYNKFNTVTQPSDWKLDKYAPMSLGTPDITPLELAGAYAVLANGGRGITPSPIKRLFSSKSASDSKVIKPNEYQVVTPQAAYATTRMLMDVVSQGTAKATIGEWVMKQKAAGRKIPEIAAKTGTTNDCFVAWVCGYTPELVLTVYVGYDQHRSLGPKMTGGKVVGPIWAGMLDRVLKTRSDWQEKFDIPADTDFADICSKSGKLVTSSCYASGQNIFKNAAFKKGTAPGSSCPFHGGGQSGGYEDDSSVDPESQFQPEGGSIGPPGQPLQQQQYQQYYQQQQQQQQQQNPYASYYGYR